MFLKNLFIINSYFTTARFQSQMFCLFVSLSIVQQLLYVMSQNAHSNKHLNNT